MKTRLIKLLDFCRRQRLWW